jgi:hypothetical protein
MDMHLFSSPLVFLLIFVLVLGLVDSVVDQKQGGDDVFGQHPSEQSELLKSSQKAPDVNPDNRGEAIAPLSQSATIAITKSKAAQPSVH